MPRRWNFNLAPPSSSELTVSTQNPRAIAEPLGFGSQIEKRATETSAQMKSSKYAYAMREAQKPFMGMIQNAFMMWMSGHHITIWSMMMTGMGIINPIQAIMTVGAYFKRFEDGETDLTTPKLLYVALNLVSLGVALYKCKTMGLLPMTAADWTGLLPVLKDAEVAGIPL